MGISGYPLHRGNRKNAQKNSLSWKTQGIWKFCQNTGKTQGIWFAQVVNSLILKVKDISIFAVKISRFYSKLDVLVPWHMICYPSEEAL